jgi:hypothetical protein
MGRKSKASPLDPIYRLFNLLSFFLVATSIHKHQSCFLPSLSFHKIVPKARRRPESARPSAGTHASYRCCYSLDSIVIMIALRCRDIHPLTS